MLLLSACGVGSGESQPSPASSQTPKETATVDPSPSPSASGTVPTDLRTRPRVSAAIADLAVRKAVQPADIDISAWTPVTWSDGSIGCPEPGMSYIQSEVEGELLILRIDSGLYQYHSRRSGPFRFCADPAAGYSVPK